MEAMLIADYIVSQSIGKKYERRINNLELQKYLYYLNARFLVETGNPLFEDDIEKWKFGPVIPNIYHEYKSFGAAEITSVSDHETLEIIDGRVILDKSPSNFQLINEDLKNTINQTVSKLSKINRFKLVDLTHQHSEWKKDEGKILNGERHLKYTNEGIKEYFSSTPSAQIW